MIICDTSGLVAAYDADEPAGPAVRELLEGEAGALVVSPFVLAELDYLLLTRAGPRAEPALLDDLAEDVYQVAAFTSEDAVSVKSLVARYFDLGTGLAHAHTTALAAPGRYGTTRVLTFDERHFRAVKPLREGCSPSYRPISERLWQWRQSSLGAGRDEVEALGGSRSPEGLVEGGEGPA